MSKFSYENQGTNTYLVYEVGANDELDTMSLGMLTNNCIPGFAPASFMQMDMTKYIKYNVSAKVSVKQLFDGPVNKKRLLGVFMGVVDAMLSAEDYMLDTQTILLDTDHIFADVSTCETELICLPVINLQHENPSLPMFFKNILFTTQFDQTENCDHVAQLINYLNSNPGLPLADFKELLHSLSGAAAPARQPVQQVVQQEVKQTVQQVDHTAAEKTVQSTIQNVVQHTVPKTVQTSPATERSVTVPEQKQGMAIPNSGTQTQKSVNSVANEKPMSWLYLMQHYNKENAAIYKQQQDAKKAKSATPAAPPTKQKAAAKVPNNGFTIPNTQAAPNGGFAIPGQNTPAVSNFPVAEKKPEYAVQTTPSQNVVKQESAPVTEVIQNYTPPAGKALNFGETTVLSAGIGETTVLGGGVAEKTTMDPHLIRIKNNEKIPLNKPVFRIGKERSYVDYFISDNTAISRSHANIVNHNGEFFVVDTNSTNHTYVNGGMIQSNVETKLSHGTKIRLANEDFEFKLY